MQQFNPAPAKNERRILEFAPKPRPALPFDEFLRKTNANIIRNPNQGEPTASLKPFQILEFRRNDPAEQKYK
jgi:hypothetical protein